MPLQFLFDASAISFCEAFHLAACENNMLLAITISFITFALALL